MCERDYSQDRIEELERDRRECHLMIARLTWGNKTDASNDAISMVRRQDPNAFNGLRGKDYD